MYPPLLPSWPLAQVGNQWCRPVRVPAKSSLRPTQTGGTSSHLVLYGLPLCLPGVGGALFGGMPGNSSSQRNRSSTLKSISASKDLEPCHTSKKILHWKLWRNMSLSPDIGREKRNARFLPHQFQCWNVPCYTQCNCSSFCRGAPWSQRFCCLQSKQETRGSKEQLNLTPLQQK